MEIFFQLQFNRGIHTSTIINNYYNIRCLPAQIYEFTLYDISSLSLNLGRQTSYLHCPLLAVLLATTKNFNTRQTII